MSDHGGIIYEVEGPLHPQNQVFKKEMLAAASAENAANRVERGARGRREAVNMGKNMRIASKGVAWTIPNSPKYVERELPGTSTFTGGRRLPPSKKTMKRKNKPKPRTYKK
jgi:hypothetical protein